MSTFEPKPFGKYFLVEKIAVGGMAEIYKAKTFGVDGFEKLLAIKKILPHYSADKDFIAMLTDEAKLVVRLSHTNIVQIYDLGKVGDDYFISMEYIDGVNLREVMNRGKKSGDRIPVPLVVYITSEICKGLDYAHSKRDDQGEPLNIVHRDISPQNALISFEGETKIVDFGIAKAAMNVSHTTDGVLKGKVTYMSPEQALGKPVDHRTDVFSVGILLYELLTGTRLFTGDSQFEILNKIRDHCLTEDNLKGQVPDELVPILVKALAYDPKDRYETAGDFQIALTKILYSQYNDFSPKHLATLIKKWFAPELKIRKKKAQEESSISHSTRTRIEEGFHESLVEPAMSEDESAVMMQDTSRPEDSLKPSMFKAARSLTEKIAPNRLSHQKPVEKPASSKKENSLVKNILPGDQKKRPWIIWTVAAVLLIGSGLAWFWENEEPIKYDATLEIRSTPEGAAIHINGKNTNEKTPALLTELASGKKTRITLLLEGFQTWESTLKIDQTEKVFVGLTRALDGVLDIGSQPPGASIWIDDVIVTEKTPHVASNLKIGNTYRLKLMLDGYFPYEQKLDILNQQPVVVRAGLTPLPTPPAVMITSDPPQAQILINGEPTGLITPARLTNLEKSQDYQITLKLEGFDEASEKITLKDTDVKIVLKLMKTPVTTAVEVKTLPQTKEEEPKIELPIPEKKTIKEVTKKTTTEPVKEPVKESTKKVIKEPAKTPTQKPEKSKPIEKPQEIFIEDSDPGPNGRIRVDSSPRGASVIIDGRKAGITPVLIPNLKRGSHSLSLSMPGYKSWSRSVNLNQGKMEIMANMQRE